MDDEQKKALLLDLLPTDHTGKKVLYVGSMLTHIHTGEHTVWTYYIDGSVETHLAPLSKILVIPLLVPS